MEFLMKSHTMIIWACPDKSLPLLDAQKRLLGRANGRRKFSTALPPWSRTAKTGKTTWTRRSTSTLLAPRTPIQKVLTKPTELYFQRKLILGSPQTSSPKWTKKIFKTFQSGPLGPSSSLQKDKEFVLNSSTFFNNSFTFLFYIITSSIFTLRIASYNHFHCSSSDHNRSTTGLFPNYL